MLRSICRLFLIKLSDWDLFNLKYFPILLLFTLTYFQDLNSQNISFAIMVHNEGQILDKCLESIINLKRPDDEVVILDDYSTDSKTLDILEKAKKLGAIIYKKKLNYDFSEHRNYLNSKCCKDWILQIDADEILLPKLLLKIFNVIEDTSYDCFCIPRITFIVEYRNDAAFDKKLDDLFFKELLSGRVQRYLYYVFPDSQHRLYRNLDYLKWNRPIHENIVESAKNINVFENNKDECIIHYSLHYPDNSKTQFYIECYRKWLRQCIKENDLLKIKMIYNEMPLAFDLPEFKDYIPK